MRASTESPVQDEYLDKLLEFSDQVQKEVCGRVGEIDGTPFKKIERTSVSKDGRFKSISRISLLESDSNLFEKASFVVSDNWGKFTRKAEQTAHEEAAPVEQHFHATGFSMVFHPKHPMIPSTRIHYHLIIRGDGFYWYSGGGDLTPAYIDEEDCHKFHLLHKIPCDEILGEGWYERMKKASDEYFFVKHRNHVRGIGGTFFDNLNEKGMWKEQFNTGLTKEKIYDFCVASCEIINDAYSAIVEKHKNDPFDENNVKFMQLLRSHYTEFDLLYDRGIHFGLEVGMPSDIPLLAIPDSRWEFEWESKYAPGTPEHKTMEILRNPRDWV